MDIPIQEKNLAILLVEDNVGDVYAIKKFLTDSGSLFSVTHSFTLKDALKKLNEQSFDVVLLDLGLTDSMGLETLKKIIASKTKVPIVVMTGLDDEDIALAAVKEGAQDYLVKSNLTPEIIIRSIRYSIERKNIEEIKERNTRRFSILSSATVTISECESIKSIYDVVCENVSKLLNEVTVGTFEFADKSIIHWEGSNWIKPCSTKHDRKNWDFEFNGKLHAIKREIINNVLGEDNYLELDKIQQLENTYVIVFSRDEKHYGGLFIYTKIPLENNDIDIIEAISKQASLSIHRRFMEKKLKENESKYRSLFKETTAAKKELQKLTEELDSKVQQRTEELTQVNSLLHLELDEHQQTLNRLKESEEHLKRLNAMKDKFFGIIAHDLRNPFAVLIGSSELLVNYTDPLHSVDGEENQANFLDVNSIKQLSSSVNRSAKIGYALLENLLEWSRSQTGNLKFNPVKLNIRKLIEQNISNMRMYMDNKKIDIVSEITEDMEIIADENMLNTVLRNLLNNAVKFTHINGKITVNAGKVKNNLMVSVKDNGIGITKSNINKLFRIDTNFTNMGTAKEKGTGLGLVLCKEFIEKHDGKIWVESVAGKGSEFKFTIPLTINTAKQPEGKKELTGRSDWEVSPAN